MARARFAMGRDVHAAISAHVRTPLFQNGYALILSAFSTSGLGIVYWALAARLYLVTNVGLNSAALSSMVLFSGIAQLNLVGALIRFIPIAGRATWKFITCSYLVTAAVAGGIGLILFLARGVWTPVPQLFNGSTSFFLWFILSTMVWGVFALQDAVLTGLRQAIWVPAENIVFAVVKIVLLVALAGPLPVYGIFVSFTAPTLAAVAVMNVLIYLRLLPAHRRTAETRAVPLEARPLVRYVAGNYVGFLFFLATTTLAPVLAARINGAAGGAYVYLTWVFAYAVQLISQNMTNSLTVEGAIDQRQLEAYSYRVLVQVSRLVIPLVLLMALGAPIILDIFGSGYSAHAAGLLRLLALAAIPNIVNVLYVGIARVQQRNRAIIVVQGALCVLCLGLSVILMYAYGIIGVGIGWVIGQSAVAAVLLLTELRPLISPSLARLTRNPA